MITERLVHPAVRTMLMANEPFQYAHLIKFERPSRPDALTGLVSHSAHKYTYLTDGSRDVSFDDLSKTNDGISNGTQIYIANKVLQVSSVQEATEAKASNFTITLDGNGIGAYATAAVTIASVDATHWDVTWPPTTDLVLVGFREGDKVDLTWGGSAIGTFNIESFMANNVLRLKKIESTITGTTGTLIMSLASEEVKSILLNKNDVNYASFINREVFIYRAYFQNGVMVGASPSGTTVGPVLLFKGIISNVGFEDDENSIRVQWGLTSHWGDFAQVKGRITSDEFHRALDANGIPQPYSAIKPNYAYDKGFMHSETSINLLAKYTISVEKQKVKAKSGFLGLGIGSKVKVKKYYVDEPRFATLDFQLQAKSIPLIYGVRNVQGIPIFADTLVNNASKVYVAYALSEGQVGAIYDIYVDGKSLICANAADSLVRSTQTTEKTVDVLCVGRADRGDVLTGTTSVSGSSSNYYSVPREAVASDSFFGSLFYAIRRTTYSNYIAPTGVSASAVGITHGKSISLTTPQTMTFHFFSGTEGQVSSPLLTSLAASNSFKIQTDYWNSPGSAEYWGPNHTLMDTAYIVAEYTIKEGETTIPDIEFIVRGKVIDCYNYDYSYAKDVKATGDVAHTNFKLGQSVTLYRSDTNASIGTYQIIDKWTMKNPDGTDDVRFRWNNPPALIYDSNGVPAITKFYMQNAALQNWTMTTFNYVLYSGTVATELTTTTTTIVDSGGGTTVTYPTNPDLPLGGDTGETSPVYSVYDSGVPRNNLLLSGTASSTSLVTAFDSRTML